MSLTTVPMGVLLLLQQHGLLTEPLEACDFGSMEFDSRAPAANALFEAMFTERGKDIPADFYASDGRMYGTCGDLWRALGSGYTSYDIDGRFGSTVLDLNIDQIPESQQGKSTLTMNGGTSEHVFNQYNFFLQVHKVTQVGGLMMHVVPFHMAHNHGLYSYSPTFFHSLAQYNGYEILGMWQCGKPHHFAYRSSYARPEGRRVSLISVMQRTRPGEFVFPLQVNEPMVLSAEAEERYGTFTPQALETFRRSGGLPEEFYVDIPTATVHDGPVPKKLLANGEKGKKAAKEDGTDSQQKEPVRKRGRFRLLRR
jgi:hypothetical protein